jgi:hypothetical protein
MSYYRLKLFLSGWNKQHLIVSIFAILGLALTIKNSKALFVALFAGGYLFVFTIIGAWFYRYRYPIEPLLMVLSTGPIVLLLKKLNNIILKKSIIKK